MSERQKGWLRQQYLDAERLGKGPDWLDSFEKRIEDLEASLAKAEAYWDKLEKALATDQIVFVECGYYDHGSGEGGFFLCDLSDKQLCGHSIREAIDKLEEPHE